MDQPEVVEIATPHGTFQVVYSITLGECIVALSVLLLLSTFVIKWLLETVWRKGGR